MTKIRIDDSKLNFPLRRICVGRLSSAVVALFGVPNDVDTITVQIGRTEDPDTHRPRPNFTAAAARQTDGTFRCYLSPFYFPDASDALEYHVVGTDVNGNVRWLGRGSLSVFDNPAGGNPVAPEIIPADTYIRNPATGLYHKLTAVLDEDGGITINLEEEGVER